jgi:hypothetical protein
MLLCYNACIDDGCAALLTMGLKLDWEIEAGQTQVQNTGEDPEAQRKRRRLRNRLLIGVIGLLVMVGACIAVIQWRLADVDFQFQRQLIDTIAAEAAALRIGDRDGFLAIQHTANQAWLDIQNARFDAYQQMMLADNLQVTGRVVSTEFDRNYGDLRARVTVEEILNGVSYTSVQFYWFFSREDGWAHVAPDYGFWGETAVYEGRHVIVNYRTADTALAAQMGAALDGWIETGCTLLSCTQIPLLVVEIMPSESMQPGWLAPDSWTLQMPSPYTRLISTADQVLLSTSYRTRADQPFDTDLQLTIGGLLADRLVAQATNNMQPLYPYDAFYLRQGVVSWLVGRFTGAQTNAFVIDSLARQHGDAAVTRLVQALQPNSDARILAQAAGVASLDQANLDWRDFLTWRLVLEADLIARRDQVNFAALYDFRAQSTQTIATARFEDMSYATTRRVVTAVTQEIGLDGAPQLRATVQVGDPAAGVQEEVIFTLVDGLWKRAQ